MCKPWQPQQRARAVIVKEHFNFTPKKPPAGCHAWSLVPFLVTGPWSLVPGPCALVPGPLSIVDSPWGPWGYPWGEGIAQGQRGCPKANEVDPGVLGLS